jgi:predicted nucleic acid-binding protein
MIILDTNVLSALMRRTSDTAVVQRLDRQPAESIWITSVTLFETHLGLALLPKRCRREGLEATFASLLEEGLENRVLDFDSSTAVQAPCWRENVNAPGVWWMSGTRRSPASQWRGMRRRLLLGMCATSWIRTLPSSIHGALKIGSTSSRQILLSRLLHISAYISPAASTCTSLLDG